jgi:hypothetical protein
MLQQSRDSAVDSDRGVGVWVAVELRIFPSRRPRPTLGPTQSPIQSVTGAK